MPISFTGDQLRAINARAENLLVAAAAGSGKTAVLAERIMRIIMDPAKPVDIDRLLVVTFTEAAASEMRQRISNRISQALEADPQNERLARQAMLLPAADISTIHAFCRKVMKRYFHTIDLDPEFRVGDDTELRLLQYQVLEELFEGEYAAGEGTAFTALVDSYGGGKTRDDGLAELIRKLHEFAESTPYPEITLRRCAEMYNDPENALSGSVWAETIRAEARRELGGALAAIRHCKSMAMLPMGPSKYLETLELDEENVLGLIDAAGKTLTELYEALRGMRFERLPAYRGKAKDEVSEEIKDVVKNIRESEYKNRVGKLQSDCFFKPPADMEADVRSLSGLVKALVELALKFSRLYAEAKRERGIVDFDDMQHFCIEILLSPPGDGKDPGPPGLTDAARELAARYEEVMIDEYQDSNAVQELILSSVSRARFMVGDVKQSVYKFRRANPYLFIEKYERFEDWAEGVEAVGARVGLSRNFRSRADVIGAVNFFFSRIMTKEVGETEYDERAALYPGASFPPAQMPGMYDTEFDLIEYVDKNDEGGGGEDGLIADISKAAAEAGAIGRRVLEFIGPGSPLLVMDDATKEPRPCRQGDIVILVRSVGVVGRVIAEELKKLDIDAVADSAAGFFESVEVQTALSFLQIIDNPLQDVYLITALHSPVYGFTPDELLDMRHLAPEKPFYECLEMEGGGKALNFLVDLSRWRDKAVYMPISGLLSLVLDETGYYDISGALPGGASRQANLRELLERAAKYEATSFRGLFHFIRYMDRLRKTGAEIRPKESAEAEAGDRVRIMTIHKSKGLEFPVVFVSMLGKQFNRADERDPVIFHQSLGVGAVYVNLGESVKTDTLPRFAISRRIRQESVSEELRVLYVAMTRAKEKLVLTACVDRLGKRLEKWGYIAGIAEKAANKTLPAFYRASCQSFVDFLAPCLAEGLFGAGGAFEREGARFDIRLLTGKSRSVVKRGEESAARLRFGALSEMGAGVGLSGRAAEIAGKLWWGYPYGESLGLPSKVSISELKRAYQAEMAGVVAEAGARRPAFDPPEFLREGAPKSSMFRGTAIHTVMEHLDLEMHRGAESIKALIGSLTERNILPADAAALIPVNKIVLFANSSLADRMRQSNGVHRETPFVMGLPAKEVYRGCGSGETILVHGIIDCWFEEGGKIIIVDYKSDALPQGGADEIVGRYRVQMSVYAKAMERAAGNAQVEVLLYLFALDGVVSVGLPRGGALPGGQ